MRRLFFAASLLIVPAAQGCSKSDDSASGEAVEQANEGERSDEQAVDRADNTPIVFNGDDEDVVFERRGVAGYDEPAVARHGESCDAGHVPRAPQHTFTVEAAQTIRAHAVGDVDLTMIVRGDGESRCNDDAVQSHPAVTFLAEPGEYEVFVGTFADDPWDPTPEYELQIGSSHAVHTDSPFVAILRDRVSNLESDGSPERERQIADLNRVIDALSGDGGDLFGIEEQLEGLLGSSPGLIEELEAQIEANSANADANAEGAND